RHRRRSDGSTGALAARRACRGRISAVGRMLVGPAGGSVVFLDYCLWWDAAPASRRPLRTWPANSTEPSQPATVPRPVTCWLRRRSTSWSSLRKLRAGWRSCRRTSRKLAGSSSLSGSAVRRRSGCVLTPPSSPSSTRAGRSSQSAVHRGATCRTTVGVGAHANRLRSLFGRHRRGPGLLPCRRPDPSMTGGRMRRFVRENSLSLGFGLLFLAALVGQAAAGLADFNNQQVAGGMATVSFGRYVTSADFAVDVTENWQSEYLQFSLYIVLTVWLVQRGSPESKEPRREGVHTGQGREGRHTC